MGGEPVEALVEAVATRGARGLDVPGAAAQGLQTQLLCDLGCVHGVGKVLKEQQAQRSMNNERTEQPVVPSAFGRGHLVEVTCGRGHLVEA